MHTPITMSVKMIHFVGMIFICLNDDKENKSMSGKLLISIQNTITTKKPRIINWIRLKFFILMVNPSVGEFRNRRIYSHNSSKLSGGCLYLLPNPSESHFLCTTSLKPVNLGLAESYGGKFCVGQLFQQSNCHHTKI